MKLEQGVPEKQIESFGTKGDKQEHDKLGTRLTGNSGVNMKRS